MAASAWTGELAVDAAEHRAMPPGWLHREVMAELVRLRSQITWAGNNATRSPARSTPASSLSVDMRPVLARLTEVADSVEQAAEKVRRRMRSAASSHRAGTSRACSVTCSGRAAGTSMPTRTGSAAGSTPPPLNHPSTSTKTERRYATSADSSASSNSRSRRSASAHPSCTSGTACCVRLRRTLTSAMAHGTTSPPASWTAPGCQCSAASTRASAGSRSTTAITTSILSLPSPARTEDREFELRMGVNPNRISSSFYSALLLSEWLPARGAGPGTKTRAEWQAGLSRPGGRGSPSDSA